MCVHVYVCAGEVRSIIHQHGFNFHVVYKNNWQINFIFAKLFSINEKMLVILFWKNKNFLYLANNIGSIDITE